eukprot:SAG11_NODE_35964_length_264_cov_0.624242_1_plen_61_part_01
MSALHARSLPLSFPHSPWRRLPPAQDQEWSVGHDYVVDEEGEEAGGASDEASLLASLSKKD